MNKSIIILLLTNFALSAEFKPGDKVTLSGTLVKWTPFEKHADELVIIDEGDHGIIRKVSANLWTSLVVYQDKSEQSYPFEKAQMITDTTELISNSRDTLEESISLSILLAATILAGGTTWS